MINSDEKHEAWFQAVHNDGKKPIDAYMELYPECSKKSAVVMISRLKKKFSDRLYDEVQQLGKYSTPRAMKMLLKLAEGAAQDSVKLKASMALLDYAGHKAAEKTEISITDKTEKEIDTRLAQLMGRKEDSSELRH